MHLLLQTAYLERNFDLRRRYLEHNHELSRYAHALSVVLRCGRSFRVSCTLQSEVIYLPASDGLFYIFFLCQALDAAHPNIIII